MRLIHQIVVVNVKQIRRRNIISAGESVDAAAVSNCFGCFERNRVMSIQFLLKEKEQEKAGEKYALCEIDQHRSSKDT